MNIIFNNITDFKVRLFINDETYYIESKKELMIDVRNTNVHFCVSQCRNSEIDYLLGCKLLKLSYSFNLESSYRINNCEPVSAIRIELFSNAKVGVRMDYYSYIDIRTNIPNVTRIEQRVCDKERIIKEIQKANKYETIESLIITCWYLIRMYIFESVPLILAFFAVKQKYGVSIAAYMILIIVVITFLVVSLIWVSTKGAYFLITKDKGKRKITSYKNYNSFFDSTYINDVLEYGNTSHRTKDHVNT